MSNEPIKNAETEIEIKLEHLLDEFYSYSTNGKYAPYNSTEIYRKRIVDLFDSHLRSLVGEKGREALAERFWEDGLKIQMFDWSWAKAKESELDRVKFLIRRCYEFADSLIPIIGGIVAAREEAIRKEGRQEVIDWIWHNHSKLYIDPGNLSKFQIEPTEWLMQLEAWGIT